MKPGANQPCPCGSGKKYKRCCGPKRRQTSPKERALMLLLASILVVSVVLLALGVIGDDSEGGSGKVWSEEHQHYHMVP